MAIDLPRISVRPFRLTDADDFLSWAGDDQVSRYTRMETCGSREEALTFIREECVAPFRRSICLNDISIGIVWVLPYPGEDKFKADLGYAIGVKYWGQGIATKAVKIVMSQVFQDFPDLKRLQAFTHVENKSSQRVLQKVGFHKEGLLRSFIYAKGQFLDVSVFSFLPTDEFLP